MDGLAAQFLHYPRSLSSTSATVALQVLRPELWESRILLRAGKDYADFDRLSSMIVTLYRTIGQKYLEEIAKKDFSQFPIDAGAAQRAPVVFYPEELRDHALQIARDWNTRDEESEYTGYLLRCRVQCAEDEYPTDREIWLDANSLANLNRQLVGAIEIDERFDGRPSATPVTLRSVSLI